MASNNDIIKESLSILGVLSEVDPVSAEQGQNGLAVMNDMLSEWAADGIDVGQYPQTGLNDTSPVYDDALQTVKYNLALALAPYYQKEPSLPVAMLADRGYKRLLRDAINAKLEEADMTHMPGVTRYYNIMDW